MDALLEATYLLQSMIERIDDRVAVLESLEARLPERIDALRTTSTSG